MWDWATLLSELCIQDWTRTAKELSTHCNCTTDKTWPPFLLESSYKALDIWIPQFSRKIYTHACVLLVCMNWFKSLATYIRLQKTYPLNNYILLELRSDCESEGLAYISGLSRLSSYRLRSMELCSVKESLNHIIRALVDTTKDLFIPKSSLLAKHLVGRAWDTIV